MRGDVLSELYLYVSDFVGHLFYNIWNRYIIHNHVMHSIFCVHYDVANLTSEYQRDSYS